MNNKKQVVWPALGVAVIIIAWLLYYLLIARWTVTTDDAYVDGNMIQLGGLTTGKCIGIFADVPDHVAEGQLLIEVDPSNAQINYDRASSDLAITCQEVLRLRAERNLAKMQVHAREIEMEQALSNYRHREPLIKFEAIPGEELEQARTNLDLAKANISIAKDQLDAAEALVGPGPIKQHPRVLAASDNVRAAYLELSRTRLSSPCDAVICQRSIQLGEIISPERGLLMMLPLSSIWVDANLRETQLEDIRVGQPAELSSDIYGDRVRYHGRVAGIAPASGAKLSILPPQNATGNWIKIVQRFPVRILLDVDDNLKHYPLYAGASMHVKINTRDRSGPRVRLLTKVQPALQTQLLPISLDGAEKHINTIINHEFKDSSGSE